jgi:hypothetical protein
LILRGAIDAVSVVGPLALALACGAVATGSGCALGEQACCW